MSPALHFLLIAAASFGAGAVNAVAGGGTLLTFPALVALGLPPIVANATSTVGLVPGSLAGAWGFRRELWVVRGWLPWLLPSSFVGGGVGAVLLLVTSPGTFDRLVPWLVLGATLLFAISDPLSRRLGARIGGPRAGTGHSVFVAIAQLFVAVYGGYFGAGIGILMLASLAFLGLGSLYEANGLKNVAGACINAVAAAIFLAKGLVDLPSVGAVVLGSINGGLSGAGGARRIGVKRLRIVQIAIGLLATAMLLRRVL